MDCDRGRFRLEWPHAAESPTRSSLEMMPFVFRSMKANEEAAASFCGFILHAISR
jgi:hypothetical protein